MENTTRKDTHTGTKWHFKPLKFAKFAGEIVSDTPDGNYVASIIANEECEANANLIASAPELLRGLEMMTESYEYWMGKYQPEAVNSQMMINARNAIQKASGKA